MKNMVDWLVCITVATFSTKLKMIGRFFGFGVYKCYKVPASFPLSWPVLSFPLEDESSLDEDVGVLENLVEWIWSQFKKGYQTGNI